MTIKHCIIKLMHHIKYVDAIKYYKIFESAPKSFGSQAIHHHGALYRAWTKIIQAQYKAPWWWILRDPKRFGALSNIL